VQDSARLLADNTDRYVFTSTVSVYADFNIHNLESSPLATMADETVEDVTGETYGALKVLCEKRAASEIAADKLAIIRPTYVCGPGDHTDRFSYWPVRTRKGGEMIWPGMPSDVIQIIDVNDLANFTLDCVDHEISGIFNAVNPAGKYTMADLLEDSQAVSGTTVDPLWLSEDFLYEHDLAGSRSIPIWSPSGGENGGSGTFSGKAARAAGLHNRPPRETARNLLTWWDAQSEERRANMKAGLSAEREAELIAAWKARGG
jgi:2'-hydroxyisoflavone reductase